ncbi:MAG: ATP-binding protein [Cyanobacteria bacterium P01_D01_bin.156]
MSIYRFKVPSQKFSGIEQSVDDVIVNLFKRIRVKTIGTFQFSNLSLAGKILIPMLSIFLGMWSVGTVSVGYFETRKQEEALKAETQKTTVQIVKEIESSQELLGFQAKSITDITFLTEIVASGDQKALLKALLPLKLSFHLDWIKIIDPEGKVLADLRSSALGSARLHDTQVMSLAQNGLLVDGVVIAESPGPPLLIKTLSITSKQEDVGSILVGHALTPNVLTDMLAAERQQLIVLQGNNVISSTLPTIDPSDLAEQSQRVQQIQLDGISYLSRAVELPWLNSDEFQIIVLTPLAQFHASQRQMWLLVYGIGLLGGGLISITGLWTTRLITNRITKLTEATQKLAADDLSISIPVDGNDEVAVLAKSFNYMTEQLKYRDVKIRTQVEELEELVQQLQQMPEQVHMEKMAGLGQMVAGVAHEINNPISFIYGNIPAAKEYFQDLVDLTKLYQKHLPLPPKEIQDLEKTIDIDFIITDLSKVLDSFTSGAERIREIVLSLRTFSRKDEAIMKTVNLHDGIDSTLVILQHRLNVQPDRPAITVLKDYGSIPRIQCFAGEINQVFMNLLTNAVDALEEHTKQQRTVVKHDEGSALKPHIRIHTEVIANRWIKVSIADNGTGIPSEIQTKLFEPFFTTKVVGEGTGLGLSISYQIVVKKHKGKIWCNSEIGQGTEFVIQLPLENDNATTQ